MWLGTAQVGVSGARYEWGVRCLSAARHGARRPLQPAAVERAPLRPRFGMDEPAVDGQGQRAGAALRLPGQAAVRAAGLGQGRAGRRGHGAAVLREGPRGGGGARRLRAPRRPCGVRRRRRRQAACHVHMRRPRGRDAGDPRDGLGV